MSGEVTGPYGVSPVARGRTWLPGRVRASVAAAGCAAIMGSLVWALWPGSARGPDRTAASGSEWNMGRALPELSLVVPPSHARAHSRRGADRSGASGRRGSGANPDTGLLGGHQRRAGPGAPGHVAHRRVYPILEAPPIPTWRRPAPAANTRNACGPRVSPTRRRCRVRSTFTTRSKRAPSSPARRRSRSAAHCRVRCAAPRIRTSGAWTAPRSCCRAARR